MDRKTMNISEQLTYSTVLIKSFSADGQLCMGTGFIISLCMNKESKSSIPVIVTNNHVIEGAYKTSFALCKADANRNPIDTDVIEIECDSRFWIKHPDPSIDLCCLPLHPHIEKYGNQVFYISLHTGIIPNDDDISKLNALEDVIMVGYPTGLSDVYNHKPLFRKGITSTDIKKNYNGKFEFLVDMACFPGSSGSPVFIYNQSSYSTSEQLFVAGTRVLLVGVLWGGPQYQATGDITFSNIPHVLTNVPTNLGNVIKSNKILDFEAILYKLSEETNNGQT